MIDNQKYIRLNVSDVFILYTKRKDNIFCNSVKVAGLKNNGKFEIFERKIKEHKYRFKSGLMADFFFETVNNVMDYQDAFRNYIAPIDYRNCDVNNPDNSWVASSLYIGPYQFRKISDCVKPYDKQAELQQIKESRCRVPLSPKSQHIILDTAQIEKNGIFYVYNLLVKHEDLKQDYNPYGLATVEIIGFLSENDADNYAQSSELFKEIAKNNSGLYNKYGSLNKKRMEIFNKITTNMRESKEN